MLPTSIVVSSWRWALHPAPTGGCTAARGFLTRGLWDVTTQLAPGRKRGASDWSRSGSVPVNGLNRRPNVGCWLGRNIRVPYHHVHEGNDIRVGSAIYLCHFPCRHPMALILPACGPNRLGSFFSISFEQLIVWVLSIINGLEGHWFSVFATYRTSISPIIRRQDRSACSSAPCTRQRKYRHDHQGDCGIATVEQRP